MITTLKNYKTEAYKRLKETIMSPNFPWNYYGTTIQNQTDDLHLMSHCFLARPGQENPYTKSLSEHTPLAAFVCQQILGMNEIEVHMFYRIAVNLVFDTEGTSVRHVDHEYPHENLIVYLNKFDKGRTLVYDNDDNEYSVTPKEDKAVTFNGSYQHCHESSSNGRRIALIATYLRDE